VAFDRDRPECPGRCAQRLVPGRGRRGPHPAHRHRVLGDGQHVRRALCPTIPTWRPIVGEPAQPLRGGKCPLRSSPVKRSPAFRKSRASGILNF
jgi:hypothetical protein